jgi:hypothetical protein
VNEAAWDAPNAACEMNRRGFHRPGAHGSTRPRRVGRGVAPRPGGGEERTIAETMTGPADCAYPFRCQKLAEAPEARPGLEHF